MTTSQTGFLSEILTGGKVNEATLAYFRERLRNRIHQFILRQFQARQRRGLTQADVARVLGRRPEQINRWLGTPGNWTLDTMSDLMLAISKAELEFSEYPLENRGVRNYNGPDWIKREDLAVSPPAVEGEIPPAPPTQQFQPVQSGPEHLSVLPGATQNLGTLTSAPAQAYNSQEHRANRAGALAPAGTSECA